MNIVNTKALVRGETLVRHALMGNQFIDGLTASDYIGVIAACIDQGLTVTQMVRELSPYMTSQNAELARRIFYMFEGHRRDGGLWKEGGAADDIRFEHPTLARFYPGVNEVQREMFEAF